jgi:hypothetical protein
MLNQALADRRIPRRDFLNSVSPVPRFRPDSQQHLFNRSAHRHFSFWDHDIEVIGQNGWKGGDP